MIVAVRERFEPLDSNNRFAESHQVSLSTLYKTLRAFVKMVRHLIPHEIRQIAQVPFSHPYQQVIQNRTYI